ncbi:MAG TPA: FAD/NAD(P)-binding protein [Terriglobales bacterium]|nr:FAD/NAD(P)-binding protein [Terriglobales bacterium]
MNIQSQTMNRDEGGKAVGHSIVAIVGGGFSGSMLAVELLRRAAGSLSVVLIERGPVAGRGVAYGTQFEGHLLNVRAENMSAYANVPDHFVKWAQCHYNSSVKGDDFLPRPVYGRYVSSQLQEASDLYPAQFRCFQDEAISLAKIGDQAEIHLANGQTVLADKVVLALGNFPPADLRLPGKTANSSRYVSNPWSPKALMGVSQEKSILLIGSGLTSVDVTIELRARGFDGTIHILSRRGLLPQPDAAVPCRPFPIDNIPCTARGLLRTIRLQVEKAEARGSNWREVVNSLRPVTQQIWRDLPRVEQMRFLRHLRTYWEVHRHRIAERIADQLTLQLRNGQIQMHAGRITEYREDAGNVEITYRDRKCGELAKLHVDRVVNCTGPEGDCRRVASALLLDLVEKGLARPDQLSLGLDVSDDGALIDARGSTSDFLYALGPLRKGNLWESIAVPEIRVQVAELADLLLADYQQQSTETARPSTTEMSASL